MHNKLVHIPHFACKSQNHHQQGQTERTYCSVSIVFWVHTLFRCKKKNCFKPIPLKSLNYTHICSSWEHLLYTFSHMNPSWFVEEKLPKRNENTNCCRAMLNLAQEFASDDDNHFSHSVRPLENARHSLSGYILNERLKFYADGDVCFMSGKK